MSSTNRGVEVREEDDFYETPPWAVEVILPHLGVKPGMRIVEPSAGRGSLVRALLAAGVLPRDIVAVECNQDRAKMVSDLGVETVCGFWGSDIVLEPPDRIIMNPPYSFAEDHIRYACQVVKPGGMVVALVRLAFLAEGGCRASFRKDVPHSRLEMVKRPSFTAEILRWAKDEDLLRMARELKRPKKVAIEDWVPRLETVAEVRTRLKRTDSCAYAWAVFSKGEDGCMLPGGRFETIEEGGPTKRGRKASAEPVKKSGRGRKKASAQGAEPPQGAEPAKKGRWSQTSILGV